MAQGGPLEEILQDEGREGVNPAVAKGAFDALLQGKMNDQSLSEEELNAGGKMMEALLQQDELKEAEELKNAIDDSELIAAANGQAPHNLQAQLNIFRTYFAPQNRTGKPLLLAIYKAYLQRQKLGGLGQRNEASFAPLIARFKKMFPHITQ